MFEYLMEREQEEWFRTSKRRVTFPDGSTREVEAFRLIWAWFDRSCAYEFGLDAHEILETAERCADVEDVDIGTAIGMVLNHYIRRLEAQGADHIDDAIALSLAHERKSRFHRRNGKAA
ncbi:MAG: hypothetical protein AAGF20_02855 [Pseudomonadota bacterium]